MFNRSQKIIESLFEKYIFDSEDIRKLCTLSKSSNAQIRSDVAILLGRTSDKDAERILYTLSFDRDELVKLEAVDSLAMGQTYLSVQRLRQICFSPNSYLRFYAIQSYCDVFLNLYQAIPNQRNKLLEFLMEIETTEKDNFVLASIYKCKAICNDMDAVYRLIQMHASAIESNDFHLITPIFNLLSEITEYLEDETSLRVIENYMKTLETIL